MSSGPQTQAQEPPANADPGETASLQEVPNEERAVAPVAQASTVSGALFKASAAPHTFHFAHWQTVRIDVTPVGPQRGAEDLVLEGQQSSASLSVQAPIQIEGQDPQNLVAQAETNVPRQQQNDVSLRPAASEQSSFEERPISSAELENPACSGY
uniref:Uncharacterized protein n=1 Tax=Mycena chlorophos TaxID=658473 RepID=A0ABQ0L8P1_MYCCL|nr:predicted protein [Mycena chlorophos]